MAENENRTALGVAQNNRRIQKVMAMQRFIERRATSSDETSEDDICNEIYRIMYGGQNVNFVSEEISVSIAEDDLKEETRKVK